MVVLARDETLGRKVAIKLLAKEFLGNDEVRARFAREARTQTRIDHPHVVKLFDCQLEGDDPYLSMEYVPGRDLGGLLKRAGALPLDRVERLAREVGGALDALHAEGILHRDLKPANLMIRKGDGGAMVMDLGLAGVADATLLTRTGQMLGTPRYFPPELVMGIELGPRADQFQFAAILFEALTGQYLIQGKDIPEVLHVISEGRWAPYPESPEVPERVREALRRATQLDPERRFADCRDLARALCGEATERTQHLDLSEPRHGRVGGRPPPGALSPHEVVPGAPSPSRPSALRLAAPAVLVVGFLVGLLLQGGAEVPEEARLVVEGDSLIASFRGGDASVRLEVLEPDGTVATLIPSAPDARGRRRAVYRGLRRDAEVVARLVWAEGQGAATRVRAGEEALGPVELGADRTVVLHVRRPLLLQIDDQPPRELEAGEVAIPLSPDTGPLRLRWEEAGAEKERRVERATLHREALERLRSFTGGLTGEERRRLFFQDPDLESRALDAEARVWEELRDWIPPMLTGPLSGEERRELLLRVWDWERLRAARRAHRGEPAEPFLPPRTAGAVAHLARAPARLPEEAGPSPQGATRVSLRSLDGLGFDEGREAYEVVPMVSSVVKALRETEASTGLELLWPRLSQGNLVELRVVLSGITPELQARLAPRGAPDAPTFELWHPAPRRDQSPRWTGAVSVWVPRDLAPRAGTPFTLTIVPFAEPVTWRIYIYRVEVAALWSARG